MKAIVDDAQKERCIHLSINRTTQIIRRLKSNRGQKPDIRGKIENVRENPSGYRSRADYYYVKHSSPGTSRRRPGETEVSPKDQ
jgi:hypothetical protein